MEGNKKVLTLLLPLYYKSDWLRQQILWNLRKAAFIFILCFLDNFLISKSCLSLSNTETLCEEHVNLLTFLGYCLQVLWLVEILITHTHTHTHTHTQNVLKMEFEYIFYFGNGLFVAISILCVKMKTFLCRESVLRHAYYCKLRHVHCVLPGSLLKNNEWGCRVHSADP